LYKLSHSFLEQEANYRWKEEREARGERIQKDDSQEKMRDITWKRKAIKLTKIVRISRPLGE